MNDTDYANRLGDQLEIILGEGADEFEDIVGRLNESDVRPPSGNAWTSDALLAELRRLGA
jgi:hypothetical protein